MPKVTVEYTVYVTEEIEMTEEEFEQIDLDSLYETINVNNNSNIGYGYITSTLKDGKKFDF
ncbi:hypothetical protein [Psychromonas ossibalaenae]|uniref:hypothetical protein n=1 Tax=Psychromonas ossibalaenae TaxID=444922 RepID=UPI0003773067|nr:hypothetical protein [Psychromonas ossibalaenae]